ncbi:MAG: DUF3298 and DUF4163 domain-containing protein [Flavobacteriaceae bacterium]|uniref:DUF3298 and DUF4163 domain-containing protein n=1 Tax=Flagellimonas sp. SN16 TaxID=3415142 RepID=UPI003C60634F|nr:DUF3298 and DUF4163 domain-containing protein [Flavobacteriaceae bacterium]
MKKTPYLIFLLLIALGCENESNLTFEPMELQGENCKDCPTIEINVPKALDDTAVAKTINRSLEEEMISLLSFGDGEEEITGIQSAMTSFTDSFKELNERFPDETPGWEAKIDGTIVYEDPQMITIQVESYTYTGGAHGYGSTSYLNFDKQSGTELENWELFDDLEGFQKFAETKFRIQEDIPQDENINATGFMFDGDVFHLSNNMGYTKDGLQLIYNQYEVASYADGPIVLVLPYNEINLYLKQKVKS